MSSISRKSRRGEWSCSQQNTRRGTLWRPCALRSLAVEKGLEFVAGAQADIPVAFGDRQRLTQCLLNLAGNALKFTRQGRVEIWVECQGERLVYRVADTGTGIPQDQLESI